MGEYWKTGAESNDPHKTNVPSIRVAFRFEVWVNEVRNSYVTAMNDHKSLELILNSFCR